MQGNRVAIISMLLTAVLGLGGCGTVSQGIAPDGESATHLVFPPPSDATLRGGTFPSVAQLRSIAPGMTKDQLYQMFGPPHFHEGVFGVREWDYLFNFRTGDSGKYVTCEFKVLFDTREIARSFYWKPQSCAGLIKPHATVAVSVPTAPTSITLAADALFGFDEWRISSRGRAALGDLLVKVASASRVEAIRVIGYTDRIGTAAYNRKLSQLRADAVRDYLVAHGVPAGAVSAEGRGEADPLVACNQLHAHALIVCLAPNRRVEVSGRLDGKD